MSINERIKKRAKELGYTIEEVEQKCGLGKRTIYAWDKNSPSIDKVKRVADLLETTPAYVMGWGDENADDQIRFALWGGEKGMTDALYMAEDALALALFELERSKAPIPKPSELDAIALEPGEFVSYVCCDTIGYQKMHNNKAVKKTLSIPEWLNEAALAKGLNFSQILQDGLRAALNV